MSSASIFAKRLEDLSSKADNATPEERQLLLGDALLLATELVEYAMANEEETPSDLAFFGDEGIK